MDLRSTDPAAEPIVTFNLFGDERDLERMVQGVRLALELVDDCKGAGWCGEVFEPDGRIVAHLSRRTWANAAKAQLIGSLLDLRGLRALLLKGAKVDLHRLRTDEQALRHFVRTRSSVQFHASSTCRMGPASAAQAVVDPLGRVHRIEGLRVVDSSIFPTVPAGYPHFIVLMAAEKLAAGIKCEWLATG